MILTRSLKTIDREEMLEIEALHELRVYLQAQKTVRQLPPGEPRGHTADSCEERR